MNLKELKIIYDKEHSQAGDIDLNFYEWAINYLLKQNNYTKEEIKLFETKIKRHLKGIEKEVDKLENTEEMIYDYCLECNKLKAPLDADICLCNKCRKLFDLDKLWRMHDKGKIDVLDFNEYADVRDKFRLKKENEND